MSLRRSQILGGLLPDGAHAYEFSLGEDRSDTMTPRQREFSAGRACAHAALRQMGVDGPVGRNRDRSPAWPPGTKGSISHCAHFAVAVASCEVELKSLGVDVEDEGVVGADLNPVLFTASEHQLLAAMGRTSLRTALFSMKEASYKCWFPITGVVLEFTDIEVSPDPTTDHFTANMVTPSLRQPMHVQTQCRFSVHQGHVFATAWI